MGYWPAIQAISSTYANRPAAGHPGRWWQQTDGPFSALDLGSAWQEYAYGQLVFPQALPTTWRNQGGATADVTKGGLILDAVNVNGTDNLRIREQALGATPWTHTLAFVPGITPKPLATNAYTYWTGLVMVESSSGKCVTFVLNNHHDTTVPSIAIDNWTSVSAYGSNYTKQNSYGNRGPLLWLQVSDNGTTVTYRIGDNRNNLIDLFSQAHGTGFTTAPDKIGVVLNDGATGALSPELHTNNWATSWE